MSQFVIYADGSCRRNPGPGAAAVVITTADGEIVKEFVKSFPNTTNNRMELTAVIGALKAMPACDITLVSDSQYVVKGITEWVRGWKAKGWLTSQKKSVENQDLWMELDALVQSYTGRITWKWVRGHAGTPGNERADELAQEASGALCR
ncbi:MAG TPA: ribonuclease HI [Armatimonadota bacterium]